MNVQLIINHPLVELNWRGMAQLAVCFRLHGPLVSLIATFTRLSSLVVYLGFKPSMVTEETSSTLIRLRVIPGILLLAGFIEYMQPNSIIMNKIKTTIMK